MLYLLGGAARAGKSTVADKFLAQTGIPYFSLDYLMMGCGNGAPQLGIDPDDSDLQVATLLTPIIRAMAVAMIENGEDYLLEGVAALPSLLTDLAQQFPGQVAGCFLGYADADVKRKATDVQTYTNSKNNWLAEMSEDEVMSTMYGCILFSQFIRDECVRLSLPYYETSTKFAAKLDEVVLFLRKQGGQKESLCSVK